ncbi:MAG: cyclic nucleotide-binding domain-containing protein [Ktedonobacterales bacterium]
MTEMTESTQPVVPIGDHVAQHPFLRALDGEYLDLLAAHARVERFAPGTYLLRERHAAQVCYLIEHGRVALEINGAERGQIVVETIEAGECLGWSWLFPPFKWHFSGRAIDTVQAIVLDGVSIRELCESNRSFGYELMKRIAGVVIQRLQAARLGLLDIYGQGKRDRV